MDKIRHGLLMLLVGIVMLSLLCGCDLLEKQEDEPSERLAKSLLSDGEIDEAIDMYEDLIDEDEDDHDYWEGLVEAYMEDEDYESASHVMEDWKAVIEEQYRDGDNDYEDGLDAYADLAEDIMDEDSDIQVPNPQLSMVDDAQASSEELDEMDLQDGNIVISDTAVDLELGEVHYIFLSEDEMILEMLMTELEAYNAYDVDFDMSIDEIEEMVFNQIDSNGLGKMELLSVSKGQNGLFVSVHVRDIEAMADMDLNETVSYYKDNYYYSDFEDMQNTMSFRNYESNEVLDNQALASYAYSYIIKLYGGYGGAYYTFPYEIQLVSALDSRRIDGYTIYMGAYLDGIVIFNK